jgi:hypothetical protein
MTVRRAPCLSIALVAVLACASEARAAAVSIRLVDGTRGSVPIVVVTGQAAERNRITVEVGSDGLPTVTDEGAALRAGFDCEPLDLHLARCGASEDSVPPRRLDVRLGDGDDTFSVAPDFALELRVDGGAGDDAITTGAGRKGLADLLRGGPGDDELHGGTGNDLLDGGPGNDVIDGGRNGAAGDTVTYADRRRPVRVSLAASQGGEAEEHDVLLGIEGIVGGHASDVLIGDAGPNTFSTAAGGGDLMDGREGDDTFHGGNPGRDTLLGGAGDDTFDDLTGDDRVHGGPGNDVASLTGRGAVSCGPGRDRVQGVSNRRQRVGADCESVGWRNRIVLRPPRRSGRVLLVTAGSEPGHVGCVAQLSITPADEPTTAPDTPPRRLIARSSVATIGRQKLGLRLRLTRYGRRYLRAHRHVVVRVNIDLREGREWFAPRRLASYLQRLP